MSSSGWQLYECLLSDHPILNLLSKRYLLYCSGGYQLLKFLCVDWREPGLLCSGQSDSADGRRVLELHLYEHLDLPDSFRMARFFPELMNLSLTCPGLATGCLLLFRLHSGFAVN